MEQNDRALLMIEGKSSALYLTLAQPAQSHAASIFVSYKSIHLIRFPSLH